MKRPRIVVEIDTLVVHGVGADLPHRRLIQHVLEREVGRQVGLVPIGAWQSGARDRIDAGPARLAASASFGEVARAVATRVASAAAFGSTPAREGGA